MDVMQLVQSVGIPMACLIGFSYAVWSSIKWVAPKVLEPIIKSHIAFLEKMETAMIQQTDTLKKIAETQTQQAQILKDHAVELSLLRNEINRIAR